MKYYGVRVGDLGFEVFDVETDKTVTVVREITYLTMVIQALQMAKMLKDIRSMGF